MENTLALFLFAGWNCLCPSSQLLLFLLWTRDDKILLWDIPLWGICRVKHLELLVLPEPEQNPWLKEESLGLGHKNQRPYQSSNGILFSAFLNESSKVCMPGFNLSKEIKKYCYINTNTAGIQQPAHNHSPPHQILFTRLTMIHCCTFSRILCSDCVLRVEQGKQEEQIASIMLRRLKEKM